MYVYRVKHVNNMYKYMDVHIYVICPRPTHYKTLRLSQWSV